MRVLSLCASLVASIACSDLPPTPDEMEIQSEGIATWDSVEASTHTKASRPPEPVLIVDRKEKNCFKVYSVFPQEYRLPNGQAYSLRDCQEDCGTPIECPSWAQDVYLDLERRTQKRDAQNNEKKTEPIQQAPATTAVDNDTPESKPVRSTPKSDPLGPPPTDAPEATTRK